MGNTISISFDREKALDDDDLSISVNIFSQRELLDSVRYALEAELGFAVATVNLDHICKLSQDRTFFKNYKKMDFITADGAPIAWIGRRLGYSVERVAGADLILPVSEVAEEKGVPVALLGSTTECIAEAEKRLKEKYPKLRIAFSTSPIIDLSAGEDSIIELLESLRKSDARICFLAFGAPKQEAIASLGRAICPKVGFFGIGAGLDFVSGHQLRAPKRMQRLSMEWLWRLINNPNRLTMRYIRCAGALPRVFIASLRYQYHSLTPFSTK